MNSRVIFLPQIIMPFTTIYVHLVWCTKNRDPFLKPELKKKLFQHIRFVGTEKKIHIDAMDGHLDHIHCLISLKRTQSISQVAKELKGCSSRWLSEKIPGYEGTIWQPEYYAVSVGPERLNQVRKYIRNQEIHHGAKKFEDEMKEIGGFPEATPE
ncbi:MAG: IS200/IS605 family transposase [Crocinitomicaceae bacterium]